MSYIREEHMREDAEEFVQAMREEGVYPCLKRHRKPQQAPCRGKCGVVLDIDELTEDGLCCVCDKNVQAFEAGRI